MFQGFYGLLTVMLCVLCVIVVTLFNLAPITYIVFGVTILLSLLLQYIRFKKQSISEKRHTQLAWCLYIAFTLSFSWLIGDWFKYDLQTSLDQFDSFEYSTKDWNQGWPNSEELPEGLKRPEKLPEGIYNASAFRSSLAWANAYPERYNSTRNHRLYVFVDDGNTKRPHFVELLISNDGTRAVFYQSK